MDAVSALVLGAEVIEAPLCPPCACEDVVGCTGAAAISYWLG